LSGGDRLLVAACRGDREAYALGDRGVLTEVLLQGLDPLQYPSGDWITSRTLEEYIEKQISIHPVLKRQEPLYRHFGQTIWFWQGIKPVRELSYPPPKVPSYWQERTEEVKTLYQWLSDPRVQLIGITGMGGSGKSTLAAKIYENIRISLNSPNIIPNKRSNSKYLKIITPFKSLVKENQFIDTFWVDVFRNPNLRSFNGLARFVLQEVLDLPPDSEILKDEHNLLKRLLTNLRNKKYLLFIDNLETLLQKDQFIDPLYQQFFQDWVSEYGGNSVIMVTTQEKPNLQTNKCQWLNLTGLSPEEGAALLKSLEIQGNEEALQAFSWQVQGHPLAIHIIAASLKEAEGENPNINFGETNPLQIFGLHRGHNVSIEEILAASFKRIDSRLQNLLLNVSVYRRPFHRDAAVALMIDNLCHATVVRSAREGSHFEMPSLSNDTQVQDINHKRVEEDLRILARYSLLQEQRREREWWFQFHPFVLEYVRQKAENLTENHFKAIAYYHSIAKQKPWQTIADITEYQEIFYHWCELNHYERAFNILKQYDDFIELQGYNYLRLNYYQNLIEKWKIVVKEDEKYNFARALINFGNACNSMGQYQNAATCYQQALNVAQEFNNRYEEEEGRAICGLASSYYYLKDWQVALECTEKALEIARKINDAEGEISALIILGNIQYCCYKNFPKAIYLYEKTLVIAKKIGDSRREASILGNLGNSYLSFGNWKRAIDLHELRLRISQNLSDRLGIAHSLISLTFLWIGKGEIDKGLECGQRAYAIISEFQLPIDTLPFPKWFLLVVKFFGGNALFKNGVKK